MKRSALVTAVLFLASTGYAQGPLILDVWPGKAPGETGNVGPEHEVKGKPGQREVKRITDVTRPTISVFRPPADKDTRAGVLICPGGGYNILAWDLEGEEVAAWLNTIGVTGIVLKYRVPRRPDQPKDQPPVGPLQDAQRALSLVRSKAKEWNLDPKRIGILGFSAGGHLAAATAVNFDKRAYEPQDAVDELSCRPDFAVLVYPAYLIKKDKAELAPDIRIRKECPPMFFAHAGNDAVKAENSVLAYLALRKAGVSAEIHVYTTGGHGFGLRKSNEACSTWPERAADWLRLQGMLKK
jgi:acetyl esterase/lipase